MNIYLQKDGQQLGPFEEVVVRNRLSSGEISLFDMAWMDGMSSWEPLSLLLNRLNLEAPADLESSNTDITTGVTREAPTQFATLNIPRVPVSMGAAVSANSQQTKIFDYLLQAVHRGKSSTLVTDLQSINLKSDILPLNQHTFKLLQTDFTFWAVTLLAIVPLILVTLSTMQSQLVTFCLFFAAIWGVVFKKFVIEETGGWRLPIFALLFTGVVGTNALVLIYRVLPSFYLNLWESKSAIASLVGCILQIGICEELCKIAPVVIYLLWKKKEAQPLTIVLIGVFSGLGFSALENLNDANSQVYNSAALTRQSGVEGLAAGVQGAMVNVMCRSISSVFGHGVYSGIFSSFIAIAYATRTRLPAMFIVGWGVSATVHGLYDWFWNIQTTLPALITAFGFMLFYAYLTKLRLIVAVSNATVDGNETPPSLTASEKVV